MMGRRELQMYNITLYNHLMMSLEQILQIVGGTYEFCKPKW